MGRAQELERIESIDYSNIFGSSLYIEVLNLTIIRILPRLTTFKYSEQITDQIRSSYDSLLIQRILNIYEFTKNIYKKSTYLIIYFFLYNLQKFNFNYLFLNKLKLNFLIIFLINEDCDFSFIKKLINLSIFNFVLNYKLMMAFKYLSFNSFFFEKNLDDMLNVDIIQLIGINLRMEYPLLMFIFLQKIKKMFIKIYSIYSTQSSLFFYKSYAFNLKEFYNYLIFKEDGLNNIYFKNFHKNKLNNKVNFLYFINYKLCNLYNFQNIIILCLNYFQILQIYFKIRFKFLLETLYYYNYFFLNMNLIFKNLNINIFQNLKKTLKKTQDNLYFISYSIILFSINSTIQNFSKIKFNDLFIYIGHHFLFSIMNNYKFILPSTFFFEMDTLQYNIFGNLISGKFIYSPMLRIYENFDLINFSFFNKIYLAKNNKNYIYINLYLNYKKYFKINFNLSIFLKSFKYFLLSQTYFEINFFENYYYIIFSNLFQNAAFLINFELIKNSNFLQSQNLSFYKLNNYLTYLYNF